MFDQSIMIIVGYNGIYKNLVDYLWQNSTQIMKAILNVTFILSL